MTQVVARAEGPGLFECGECGTTNRVDYGAGYRAALGELAMRLAHAELPEASGVVLLSAATQIVLGIHERFDLPVAPEATLGDRRRVGRTETEERAESDGCALCSDQGPLVLRARCHLTAPLQVTRDADTLVVSCYVPECRREVARFKIVEEGRP